GRTRASANRLPNAAVACACASAPGEIQSTLPPVELVKLLAQSTMPDMDVWTLPVAISPAPAGNDTAQTTITNKATRISTALLLRLPLRYRSIPVKHACHRSRAAERIFLQRILAQLKPESRDRKSTRLNS